MHVAQWNNVRHDAQLVRLKMSKNIYFSTCIAFTTD